MQGKKPIDRLKQAVICFRDKANEIIDWINKDWVVTLPPGDDSPVVVREGDGRVVIDMTFFHQVEVVACDEDGNQATYILYGYKKTVPPA